LSAVVEWRSMREAKRLGALVHINDLPVGSI
jgi:hypothetical protein